MAFNDNPWWASDKLKMWLALSQKKSHLPAVHRKANNHQLVKALLTLHHWHMKKLSIIYRL